MAKQTITKHIREHLLSNLGYVDPDTYGKMPALEALQQTEWSVQFERYMRNRLVMGAFRYGLLQAPDKHDYNRVDSAIERLMEYKRTHNLELLVDSANIALLEFVEGTHPDRHWSSVDDGPHVSHC